MPSSAMQACEGRKEILIGFHVGRIEGHGLVTASGASPVVKAESIKCFTVRKDLYEKWWHSISMGG